VVNPEIIEVKNAGELLAIILRSTYREPGVHFLTSNDLSQQLAFMRHPAGKAIEPHVHNAVERRVTQTQESLFIRKGRMRVDFYDGNRTYLESYELRSGDVILLIRGGHGFEMLEDTEFVEVKQGPYAGDQDKTRFTGVTPQHLRLRE
jgi:mannose-6-phosphate isomerase-like protein (cupin superfamily)